MLVGAECAHLQQAAHAGSARGGHDLGGEHGVHGLEARTAVRVEDADEVDDRVAVGEQLAQDARLVHVCEAQLRRVEHAQALGVAQIARRHPYPVARVDASRVTSSVPTNPLPPSTQTIT